MEFISKFVNDGELHQFYSDLLVLADLLICSDDNSFNILTIYRIIFFLIFLEGISLQEKKSYLPLLFFIIILSLFINMIK